MSENSELEQFKHFLNADTFLDTLHSFRAFCERAQIQPDAFARFYPKIKSKIHWWKVKDLWSKLDEKAAKRYKIPSGKTTVLIVGAGPCGLRSAIEAQFLGAKVIVVEKRTSFSRNNVLHLWDFVLEDLKALGLKTIHPQLCNGGINHISIKRLQCILLKICLIVGVEIHSGVTFRQLIQPTCHGGWKARFSPATLNELHFDVIIGAQGKNMNLPGFTRTQLRAKQAIAISANFTREKTECGELNYARTYQSDFFNELRTATGIDLENIVFYKDDTNYFVMTVYKACLLSKAVLKRDLAAEELLEAHNVDRAALLEFAKASASFCTKIEASDLKFALNWFEQPDVDIFDFTAMYRSENASHILLENGRKLLLLLVGDSLIEPFWPLGTGCAYGFLSSLDAVWSIYNLSCGVLSDKEIIEERENIYHLSKQVTQDLLNKRYEEYTLCPDTRYPSLRGMIGSARDMHELNRIEDVIESEQPFRILEDEAPEPGFEFIETIGHRDIWNEEEEKLQTFEKVYLTIFIVLIGFGCYYFTSGKLG